MINLFIVARQTIFKVSMWIVHKLTQFPLVSLSDFQNLTNIYDWLFRLVPLQEINPRIKVNVYCAIYTICCSFNLKSWISFLWRDIYRANRSVASGQLNRAVARDYYKLLSGHFATVITFTIDIIPNAPHLLFTVIKYKTS